MLTVSALLTPAPPAGQDRLPGGSSAAWLARLRRGLSVMPVFLSVWIGGFMFAIQSPGAVIPGNTNDCEIRSDGVITDLTTNGLLVGGAGSNPAKDRSPVYVFQLPDLGATNNPFTNASFTFEFKSQQGVPPDITLYGLGRRSSPAVLAKDYYGETSVVDPSDATLLQNDIMIAGLAPGLITTDAAGSTALRDYLNAQYAGGMGAGEYVFLRLSTESPVGGVNRFNLTAAEGGTAGPPDTRPRIVYNEAETNYSLRPFIWVRASEKSGILSKIATNAWAQSVYNGIVSRAASGVASHQANPDSFIRELPIDWTLSPPAFKTIGPYTESQVRGPTESKFNLGVDCAVLYYLTGSSNYARCAADILHNAVQGLRAVAPSTSAGNGGWIWRDDYLKEARVTGTQLPIIYDLLYSYLQSNQVYDVPSAGLVNFDFGDAQEVFRTLYELARDHGSANNNWSALMATCMLNSLLALDNAAERSAALQVYLVTGGPRQASLNYDYRYYTEPSDIWPESLQYASAVGNIRASHMVLLERYDPSLRLFDNYPNLPLSLSRISYLRYPNGEQISFGDGHRYTDGQPYFRYELVYQHALARGRTNLTALYGSLINGGVAAGEYNRSSLKGYASLGQHDEPLQLLWFAASVPEAPASLALPRTDRLPFAGIALQRNPAISNNTAYGLMGFVGGAAHVHSHASGMSMEIYGLGQVMGAKSGRTGYGDPDNENHYRLFAANNTIVVNAASRGEGTWGGFGINTVQVLGMEPQPFVAGVSSNVSFTCSAFSDNKGTLAEASQQRTLALIRTSPTSGYYVDLFRSKSTVNNRVATTLNGNVTNQFHDYIYRNIGDLSVTIRTNGVALPLFSQASRFQNDIGDANQQPGWRYFTNTVVSYPHSEPVWAQFKATPSGTSSIYMDLHLPAVASREVARVDSPAIVDAPGPYDSRRSPTLVVRQIGEAWDKPFAAVYEPHYQAGGGSVRNVTTLLRGSVVVGVKVDSIVSGQPLTHYVISNPNANETYTDGVSGLSFTGRFGVITVNGGAVRELYMGEGSALAYDGYELTSVGGTNTQASVLFTAAQPPQVTANAPVEVTLPVVFAPSFTRIERLDSGLISLTATGLVTAPYTLWVSTNLASSPWTSVTAGTVTASPFVIQDPDATNHATRFYRFTAP